MGITIIDMDDDDDDELFLLTNEGYMLILTGCSMQLEARTLCLPGIPKLHHPFVVLHTTSTASRQEEWKERQMLFIHKQVPNMHVRCFER